MKHIQNAQKVVKSMNGELIAFAPESTTLLHPDDYLYIVIGKFEHEYTVWLYNAEFDGMYNGYYTNSYENALIEFKRRIDRY